MRRFGIRFALPFLLFAAALLAATTAMAEGDPHKAKHVIVIMQENHSFDNYFGALA
jgi:phospholipase C